MKRLFTSACSRVWRFHCGTGRFRAPRQIQDARRHSSNDPTDSPQQGQTQTGSRRSSSDKEQPPKA